MCGICGIVMRDGAPADAASLDRMVASLAHRGPDGHGTHLDGGVGLGHTRLSIIDLSDAGRQPMTNEDGTLWITFNGEIYNHVELRNRLLSAGHTFRSRSDTEVILHLYEDEGCRCVEHLNGMFAFAIWDARQRTVFIARDRLGIKPLYYTATPHAVLFASEIKSLLRYPVAAEPDPQGVADYLTFQFCLGDKTMFRGIRKLPGGSYVLLRPGSEPAVKKYWDVDYTVDMARSETESSQALRELLDDAIRLQLRSDVAVGAHLSGGLDSTTVVALAAAKASTPLQTFTGVFDGPQYDESHYARIAARTVNSVHHEVRPSARDFVELLPQIVHAMDEPAAGPGVFPQYLVSRLAREHVKVVLGGQGADEIFGGYTRYLILYLESCIKGGIDGTQEDDRYIVTFESILPNLPQLRGYEPTLRRFWSGNLFGSQTQRYYELIARTGIAREFLDESFLAHVHDGYSPFESYAALFDHSECHSLINRMTRFDLKTLLPALLQVEDRTRMAASLESRVPLLDHRIVELVAAMPPKIKFKGGRSKHIFREVVRPFVPTEIYNRTDKMGFPVPLDQWYREEPVRSFVLDTLTSAASSRRRAITPGMVDAVASGVQAYDRGVWGVMNLELWMQTFIDAPQSV